MFAYKPDTMPFMNIVLATDAWSPQVNGVVTTYKNLISALEAQGHRVILITPLDFKTIPFPFYPDIRLAFFPQRKIHTVMKTLKADAVHIATEGPIGWSMRSYCLNRNIPFSTSYHTHFPDYAAAWAEKHNLSFLKKSLRALAIKIFRHFHNAAHAIFVATPSLNRELKSWNFSARMVALGRGVDKNIFFPDDQTPPLEGRKPVAIYVGRVSTEKNLPAFLNMPWSGEKIIVGDGPDRLSLERQYPQATFTGVKSGRALGDAFRSADIFVFPSKTDTFGMVMIEAMACGLPVAGYAHVTGPQDIITEPFLGVIDDDLGIAAQKALMLVNTDDRQKRLAYVREHFQWDKVAKEFLDGMRYEPA